MSGSLLTEAAPLGRACRVRVNPRVFFVSAAPIPTFALFGAFFPGRAERMFSAVQSLIILDFGWRRFQPRLRGVGTSQH